MKVINIKEDSVMKIDEGIDIYYVGTAKNLANMVKEWIIEDLYRIPDENGRSFLEDEEFKEALEVADRFDEIATWNSNVLYSLHYIDGEGYVNGEIKKLVMEDL